MSSRHAYTIEVHDDKVVVNDRRIAPDGVSHEPQDLLEWCLDQVSQVQATAHVPMDLTVRDERDDGYGIRRVTLESGDSVSLTDLGERRTLAADRPPTPWIGERKASEGESQKVRPPWETGVVTARPEVDAAPVHPEPPDLDVPTSEVSAAFVVNAPDTGSSSLSDALTTEKEKRRRLKQAKAEEKRSKKQQRKQDKQHKKQAADESLARVVADDPAGDMFDRDDNGDLTAKGRKAARKALKKQSAGKTDSATGQEGPASFFTGDRRQNNDIAHTADPSSPENRRRQEAAETKAREAYHEESETRRSPASPDDLDQAERADIPDSTPASQRYVISGSTHSQPRTPRPTVSDPQEPVVAKPRTSKTRKAVYVVGAVLVLAAVLRIASQGGASEATYGAVCVDQRTNTRVPVGYCHDGGEFYQWWYAPEGNRVPAVGSVVDSSQGSYAVPADEAAVKHDIAAKGGVVGGKEKKGE